MSGEAANGPGASRPASSPASLTTDSQARSFASAPPRTPINRTRIEAVLSRAVAVIGVLFALQALPTLLSQAQSRTLPGSVIVAGTLALAILLMVFTAILQRGVRPAMTTMAVIFLLAMLAWQPLMLDPQLVLAGTPWLWYLCTVATSAAAVAWPPPVAAGYTLLAPVSFGYLRTLPAGGNASVLLATLDTIYAILLGFVVLVIISLLRRAAATVDEAQSRALGRYTQAVRQHARDVERVEVDSLVHDNVLATLLAAAGATTPQTAALAATMARQSIERLGVAVLPPPAAEVVPLARFRSRVQDFLATVATPIRFQGGPVADISLPAAVGEALFAATAQAIVNSVQHAAAAPHRVQPPTPDAVWPSEPQALTDAELQRTVSIAGDSAGGVTIVISDQGVGFDQAAVPVERLGLRVSIVERVAAVGGTTTVRSRPGRGTSIKIFWRAEPDA